MMSPSCHVISILIILIVIIVIIIISLLSWSCNHTRTNCLCNNNRDHHHVRRNDNFTRNDITIHIPRTELVYRPIAHKMSIPSNELTYRPIARLVLRKHVIFISLLELTWYDYIGLWQDVWCAGLDLQMKFHANQSHPGLNINCTYFQGSNPIYTLDTHQYTISRPIYQNTKYRIQKE